MPIASIKNENIVKGMGIEWQKMCFIPISLVVCQLPANQRGQGLIVGTSGIIGKNTVTVTFAYCDTLRGVLK